jgi:AhpD family alkylhydroperoxidase
MPLDPRDKELAAIGASIGANCEPCIEHHLRAGREAGLSSSDLDAAVAFAHGVRREAVELLTSRIEEFLGRSGGTAASVLVTHPSRVDELVALGVSVGANSHPLLHAHVTAAIDAGLEIHEVKSALKMAGYVQHHAADLTADAATRAVAQQAVVSTTTGG